MLASELVGVVDPAVAGLAERRLVGAAEHRRLLISTYIALHLHPLLRFFHFLEGGGLASGSMGAKREVVEEESREEVGVWGRELGSGII